MLGKKIYKYFFDPRYRFGINTSLGFYNLWSDEKFLKKKFKLVMGYDLDLDNPKTFNEKLQWLKLFNRKPEYTIMVDKYKVREYIADKLGPEYLIPLLGVYNTPDDIDFNALPNQFVLKCNHNSGLGMCICKDKSKLNISKVKKDLWKGLHQDYYLTNREWPYKDVPRKIICEKYMTNSDGDDSLNDYKFYAFDGVCKALMLVTGRSEDKTAANYYSMNFKRLNLEWGYPEIVEEVKKPKSFETMKKMAECLSKDLPEARIDFYEVDGKAYFGEITFFDGSGFAKFNPQSWDSEFGAWVMLPSKNGGATLSER